MRMQTFGRTVRCVPALFLVACATTAGGSYDTARSDVDRADVASIHAASDDDRDLNGPELERASFVRAVLRRNPSLESARQGWRAAIARSRQSGVLEDPMVAIEVAPLSVGSSSARFGYSATASQRLPWPGKLSLEEAVTRAEADATRRDYEGARRALALSAALLYDEYFVSVRSLEINAHHVALMGEIKAGALAQLESGRGSAQDPLQAEAELAHMEHDAVTLASVRDVTVAQMDELLHRDPSLPLPPPTKALALSDVPGLGESKRLGDEAAARRPDIEAARLRSRAEEARAERAERESYPDMTLSTSYNSMWDMPEHRWMVGLAVNLPLQRGRRVGAVEEARAARARFESESISMTDKARTETEVALKRLDEAHHILHLFETRLLPVARDQIDAARAGFISSRNDFVTVVSAEKNLRSVELEYEGARANVDKRAAELEHALGRVPGLNEKAVSR